MIADLNGETKELIDIVASKKGIKLSFKEKGEFRKTKEEDEPCRECLLHGSKMGGHKPIKYVKRVKNPWKK